MSYALLIWGFPFHLIIIEMLFRGISGLDTTSFIGSAIATAGLSFLLPLTKPKETYNIVDIDIAQVVIENGGRIVSERDQQLIPVVWASILIGFLVWFSASHIALVEPDAKILVFPKHVAVGLVNYFLAAILSAIKEKA